MDDDLFRCYIFKRRCGLLFRISIGLDSLIPGFANFSFLAALFLESVR